MRLYANTIILIFSRRGSRITGIDSDCVFGHILRLVLPHVGDNSMLPHQLSL